MTKHSLEVGIEINPKPIGTLFTETSQLDVPEGDKGSHRFPTVVGLDGTLNA